MVGGIVTSPPSLAHPGAGQTTMLLHSDAAARPARAKGRRDRDGAINAHSWQCMAAPAARTHPHSEGSLWSGSPHDALSIVIEHAKGDRTTRGRHDIGYRIRAAN